MDNNTTCHKGQYLIYIGEEKEGLQPFDDVIVQEDRGETIQGFIRGRFRAFFKAELLERKKRQRGLAVVSGAVLSGQRSRAAG